MHKDDYKVSLCIHHLPRNHALVDLSHLSVTTLSFMSSEVIVLISMVIISLLLFIDKHSSKWWGKSTTPHEKKRKIHLILWLLIFILTENIFMEGDRIGNVPVKQLEPKLVYCYWLETVLQRAQNIAPRRYNWILMSTSGKSQKQPVICGKLKDFQKKGGQEN